jgi:hypothetical protein
MTVPSERTRAILQTRNFLRELTISRVTPDLPDNVREHARALLRHYPSSYDVQLAHLALPEWYGPVVTGEGQETAERFKQFTKAEHAVLAKCEPAMRGGLFSTILNLQEQEREVPVSEGESPVTNSPGTSSKKQAKRVIAVCRGCGLIVTIIMLAIGILLGRLSK